MGLEAPDGSVGEEGDWWVHRRDCPVLGWVVGGLKITQSESGE